MNNLIRLSIFLTLSFGLINNNIYGTTIKTQEETALNQSHIETNNCHMVKVTQHTIKNDDIEFILNNKNPCVKDNSVYIYEISLAQQEKDKTCSNPQYMIQCNSFCKKITNLAITISNIIKKLIKEENLTAVIEEVLYNYIENPETIKPYIYAFIPQKNLAYIQNELNWCLKVKQIIESTFSAIKTNEQKNAEKIISPKSSPLIHNRQFEEDTKLPHSLKTLQYPQDLESLNMTTTESVSQKVTTNVMTVDNFFENYSDLNVFFVRYIEKRFILSKMPTKSIMGIIKNNLYYNQK